MKEAEGHFRSYVRAVEGLLSASAEKFDLVVAPYNSGAVMVRFAKRVADRHAVPFWPALLMPVYTPYRFTGSAGGRAMPYDNSALIPEIRQKISGLPSASRSLLFIDDEIGNGRAFNECMRIVTSAVRDDALVPVSCAIVADENGTRKNYSFPGMDVCFRPYAVRPSPDVSSVIFDLVSDSLADAFRGVGNGLLDKKQVASILLSLPVKTLVNGVPRITDGLNKEAERVVIDLARLRADFAAYIDGLIAA